MRNYVHIKKKKDDKYDKHDKYEGLLSPQQKWALENETEITGVSIIKDTKREREARIKDQERKGIPSTMHTPFDLTDY